MDHGHPTPRLPVDLDRSPLVEADLPVRRGRQGDIDRPAPEQVVEDEAPSAPPAADLVEGQVYGRVEPLVRLQPPSSTDEPSTPATAGAPPSGQRGVGLPALSVRMPDRPDVRVLATQIDLDGRVYLLDTALVGPDEIRQASELGVDPQDEDDRTDLWLAGAEAFEDLRRLARGRLDAQAAAARAAAADADRNAIADLVVSRLAERLALPPEPKRYLSTVEAAALLNIDRTTLDDMVDRAPRTLPGAPLRVGQGKARTHLRWDPERVREWAAAYDQWRSTRGRRG